MINSYDKLKVSIVIPTFKRNNFLERAVNSALNQTHSNIEIVIVDDNDPSSKFRFKNRYMIDKLRKSHNNIVYVGNDKNLGSALARNEGILKASGDFITFLDDDDIYLTCKVEKQLNHMIENELDMCFTDLRLHNEKNRLVDYRSYEYIDRFNCGNLLRVHLTRHITGTDTFMYKKELLKDIGGFDHIDVGDEFYLMYKTIKSEAKIGYLNESNLIAYVHSEEGLSKGEKKIKGEKDLYKFKQQNFSILSNKDQKYIYFRHLAVLAVTYLRDRRIRKAFYYFILSFFSSPNDFIVEFWRMIRTSARIRTI